MAQKKIERLDTWPEWFTGKTINEPIFCREFLERHHLAYTENSFFTTEGRVTNEDAMRQTIYQQLEPFIVTGMSKKVDDIMKDLRIKAQVTGLLPQTDRVHVQNGTVFLDGSFIEAQNEIVRSRFPVRFNPKVKKPERWLKFLSELFWPEDIPTLQEFIGYCLIPSNAGQKMMVIKGSGGEGKSQIGHVLSRMFGPNAKDGSVGKISENPFARADLEHIHLMIDDDMRLEALKQTNYIKAIVTAKGKMDLERKGKQSYQGWIFSRLLAFSNGDLQALYDRSDGFYRRQLVLTTKEKSADRVDDPYLTEKMKKEAESIFLWAFEGLQRLIRQNFKFSESFRIKANRENVKRDNNNVLEFLESEGYLRFRTNASASSKEWYDSYRLWCEENSMTALKSRSFSDALIAVQTKYNLEHCNTIKNSAGRRVWGFTGIEVITKTSYTDEFMEASQCTYVPKEWMN